MSHSTNLDAILNKQKNRPIINLSFQSVSPKKFKNCPISLRFNVKQLLRQYILLNFSDAFFFQISILSLFWNYRQTKLDLLPVLEKFDIIVDFEKEKCLKLYNRFQEVWNLFLSYCNFVCYFFTLSPDWEMFFFGKKV